MKKLFIVSTMTLAALAFASSAATAKISEDCERITGTVICADPVANDNASDSGQDNSQEVVTTSQGNEKNKAVCGGPGNSTSGC